MLRMDSPPPLKALSARRRRLEDAVCDESLVTKKQQADSVERMLDSAPAKNRRRR